MKLALWGHITASILFDNFIYWLLFILMTPATAAENTVVQIYNSEHLIEELQFDQKLVNQSSFHGFHDYQ